VELIMDPRIKRLIEVLDLAMGEDCFTYSEPDTHYSKGKRVCTCCGTESGKHSRGCAAVEIRWIVSVLKDEAGS
jgi:hypothetical protein